MKTIYVTLKVLIGDDADENDVITEMTLDHNDIYDHEVVDAIAKE